MGSVPELQKMLNENEENYLLISDLLSALEAQRNRQKRFK